MAIEDIIREARTRYPVGSKFIDLVHGETFTVSSHAFDSFGDNCQLYIPVEAHVSKPNKTARIYRNGKWADSVDVETGEILLENPKYPMEAIQEECKRRFPIGCEYYCVISGGYRRTLLSDAVTYSIDGEEIWAHSGGGYLYSNGEFAIAVTEDGGIKCSEIELPTEHTVMAFESAGSINSPIASTRIEEVSFKRIGAISKNKVQLDKLIQEVSFKRIKCK